MRTAAAASELRHMSVPVPMHPVESRRGLARCLAFAGRIWAPFKFCLCNSGPSIWTLAGIFWRALFLFWVPVLGAQEQSSPQWVIIAYVTCLVFSACYTIAKVVLGVFHLQFILVALDGPAGIFLLAIAMTAPGSTRVAAGLVALGVLALAHERLTGYFSEYTAQAKCIARLRVLHQLGIRNPAHVLARHPMHVNDDYDPALILFEGNSQKLADAMRIHGSTNRDKMTAGQFREAAAYMRIESHMFADHVPYYGTVQLKSTDSFLAWYESTFRSDYITLMKEAKRRQVCPPPTRSRPTEDATGGGGSSGHDDDELVEEVIDAPDVDDSAYADEYTNTVYEDVDVHPAPRRRVVFRRVPTMATPHDSRVHPIQHKKKTPAHILRYSTPTK